MRVSDLILLLYGSLRERSYSRFLTLEGERLLKRLGAETRIFDPRACRYRMALRSTIRRFENCVSCRPGPRVKSGPVRSGMAR